MEQVLIPLKNVSPAIPKKESELKELIEDLSRMGCEGLLAKPWSLRAEATLREFLFERGNQWFWTIMLDPRSGWQRYGLRFADFCPKGQGLG